MLDIGRGRGAVLISAAHARPHAGSLSLLVRRARPAALLMVGDLAFDLGCLAHERVPSVRKRLQLLDSTPQVNALALRLTAETIIDALNADGQDAIATGDRRNHHTEESSS